MHGITKKVGSGVALIDGVLCMGLQKGIKFIFRNGVHCREWRGFDRRGILHGLIKKVNLVFYDFKLHVML